MSNQGTISVGNAKKIFNFSNSTLVNYIRDGVLKPLPKQWDGETLFCKEDICKILGLKEFPNEPLIKTDEMIKILGLPKGYLFGNIRDYCDRHKIPYYCFKNTRGSHTFFLRSELEKVNEYKLQYGISFPDFVAKNYFLREIFKMMLNPVLTNNLTDEEKIMLDEIILGNKNISDASKIVNKHQAKGSAIFKKACKKVFYAINRYNINVTNIERLAKENTSLESENKLLTKKLKNKNNQVVTANELKAISSNPRDIGAPVRVISLMNIREIPNLYELSQFKRSDLAKVRNTGKKTLDMVEEVLKQFGLKLLPENSIIKKYEKTILKKPTDYVNDNNKNIQKDVQIELQIEK